MRGRVTWIADTKAFGSCTETCSLAKICKECVEDVALASVLVTRVKIVTWSLWLHNDSVVDVVLACVRDHQNRIPFFSASAI